MAPARGLRLICIGLAFVPFGCSGAIAQAGSPHDRGSIHLGTYEALTTKAHVKLWFGRYTSPAILAEADVAYIYERADYCKSPTAARLEDFYSDRFALARKDQRGYEVDDLLQINKVGFCTSDAAGLRDLAVVTKTALGEKQPPFVINWSAGDSVGGLVVNRKAPSPQKPGNSDDPANDAIAGSSELDARFLTSYTDTFKANGIDIKVSHNAGPTPTGLVGIHPMGSASRGLMYSPSVPLPLNGTPNATIPSVRPTAPRAALRQPRLYCLNVYSASGPSPVRTCSVDFAKIAEKLPVAAKKKPDEHPVARAWRVRVDSAPVAQPVPVAMRFALEIE